MGKVRAEMAVTPAPNDYEAEDDVRTLKRAMEIHMDKSRKARAHKHMKKTMKAMNRLDGFMKLRQGEQEVEND